MNKCKVIVTMSASPVNLTPLPPPIPKKHGHIEWRDKHTGAQAEPSPSTRALGRHPALKPLPVPVPNKIEARLLSSRARVGWRFVVIAAWEASFVDDHVEDDRNHGAHV